MTQTDLIIEKINLYNEVKQEYIRKFEKDPRIDEMTTIFDRVDHWLLSQQIQKERGSTAVDRDKKEGRPATEKQMNFIIDLGGDPKWTGTSFEASKYIEGLKKK